MQTNVWTTASTDNSSLLRRPVLCLAVAMSCGLSLFLAWLAWLAFFG